MCFDFIGYFAHKIPINYIIYSLCNTKEFTISILSIAILHSISLSPTLFNPSNNNSIFKTSGEVLLVKTIEHSKYTIKFYSDYTALKIMKNGNYITRIDSINGTNYGIKENGVINNDSLYLAELLSSVDKPKITYALNNPADIKVKNINLLNTNNFFGSEFTLSGNINNTFKICMPGDFNIYNATCALAVIHALNIDTSKVSKALEKVTVHGRMETALVTPKYKVIIDYAHTKDSMENLVKTLLAYKPKELISVVGCGGNRAKERRYSTGEIFGKYSDLCIITMDNPRFEELSSINNDIKVGLDKVNAKYLEIADRSEAIKYACHHALEGSIIVLVGKGHEEYQEIKGEKHYFSEKEVLKEIENNIE